MKTTQKTLQIELGERACRTLVMENTGSSRRRVWWIVSSDILAECAIAA